jgi:alginate O-acetyltransferase complex protein AlgI
LGYDLMKTFNRPYFAQTIPEFWRRWHISLSTWFKDYLYIPLGGNRVRTGRLYFNLFLVFFVSGIWHGANWTFVFWGALHGLYIVLSRLTLGKRDQLAQKLRISPWIVQASRMFITYHLVWFSWIYFRAQSLGQANQIMAKIFSQPWGKLFIPAADQMVYALMALMILLSVEVYQEKFRMVAAFKRFPVAVRWTAYAFLCVVILLIGVYNGSQFIYFQF